MWSASVSIMAEAFKAVTPAPVRRSVRARQHMLVLSRAVRDLLRSPEQAADPESPILMNLMSGWDNPGWVASPDYLVACLQEALSTPGEILECGSGLTTIVLGAIAERRGLRVWSLEHNEEWAAKVRRMLVKYRINSVRLCVRPMRNYSSFTWYDPPMKETPDFALVVC